MNYLQDIANKIIKEAFSLMPSEYDTDEKRNKHCIENFNHFASQVMVYRIMPSYEQAMVKDIVEKQLLVSDVPLKTVTYI